MDSITLRFSFKSACLLYDILESSLKLVMGGGQSPEVSVSLQDGDHDLVNLIHSLKQPALS